MKAEASTQRHLYATEWCRLAQAASDGKPASEAGVALPTVLVVLSSGASDPQQIQHESRAAALFLVVLGIAGSSTPLVLVSTALGWDGQ